MIFLNKIEIRGIVGRAEIKSIGQEKCLEMSVVTNYSYKDKEGNSCIDTMWHKVTAWIGHGVSEKTALKINRQSWVHVTGRLRASSYTDCDGERHNITEVIASGVELIENEQ